MRGAGRHDLRNCLVSRGLRLARRFDMRMRSGRDGDDLQGWEDASLTFRARMFGYGMWIPGFWLLNGRCFRRRWAYLGLACPKSVFSSRLCQLLVFRGRTTIPAADFRSRYLLRSEKQSWEDSVVEDCFVGRSATAMATMAHAAVQSNESKLHRFSPRGWRGTNNKEGRNMRRHCGNHPGLPDSLRFSRSGRIDRGVIKAVSLAVCALVFAAFPHLGTYAQEKKETAALNEGLRKELFQQVKEDQDRQICHDRDDEPTKIATTDEAKKANVLEASG